MSDKETQIAELKEKGNSEFKAKRYYEALEFYRKANALDNYSNPTLYNNIAAACHQLGNYDSAVREAERGLKIQQSTKGYTRVGAARWAMGDLEGAIAAYEQVGRLDPAQTAEINDIVGKLKQKIHNGEGKKPTANTAPQPKYNTANVPRPQTSAAPVVTDEKPMFADLAVIVFGVLHIITLFLSPGISPMLWRGALAAMAARQWFILQPRYAPNMEFAKSLLTNFAGLWFLLSAILAVSVPPPLHLVLAAMGVYCAVDLATMQRPALEARIPPQFQARILPYLDQARGQREQLLANAATCEVVSGLFLPFLGTGPIVLVAYWQFLKYRYRTDNWVQMAFGAVAQGLDKVFFHPRCPAMLGNLFTKLKSSMRQMAMA